MFEFKHLSVLVLIRQIIQSFPDDGSHVIIRDFVVKHFRVVRIVRLGLEAILLHQLLLELILSFRRLEDGPVRVVQHLLRATSFDLRVVAARLEGAVVHSLVALVHLHKIVLLILLVLLTAGLVARTVHHTLFGGCIAVAILLQVASAAHLSMT